MNIIQAIVLGAVQGATEFIPVSSSGHLILARKLMGLPEADLAFDMALNIGTLVALFAYFAKDIWSILTGLAKRQKESLMLVRNLIIATIPAVLAGVVFSSYIDSTLRSAKIVAVNLIWVGLLMLWVERQAEKKKFKKSEEVAVTGAVKLGLWQVLSLVPGISRSGITLIGTRFAGLSGAKAARFIFLMALPVTLGATLKSLFLDDGITQLQAAQTTSIVGIITSGVVGFLAIRFLMNYLAKNGFSVFAKYRVVAGLAMLAYLFI
jgi:undecaprenyl-diphosphatase